MPLAPPVIKILLFVSFICFDFINYYYSYDSLNRLNLTVFVFSATDENLYIDSISYIYKKISHLPQINSYDFTIYPNPSSGSIYALVNLTEHHTHYVNLINTLGQIVRSETIELPTGYSKIELPLNAITKGFYFLSISDGENQKTKKVLIAE